MALFVDVDCSHCSFAQGVRVEPALVDALETALLEEGLHGKVGELHEHYGRLPQAMEAYMRCVGWGGWVPVYTLVVMPPC